MYTVMATLVANADLDHIAGEQFEVMLVSTFIWLQVELVRITNDLEPMYMIDDQGLSLTTLCKFW